MLDDDKKTAVPHAEHIRTLMAEIERGSDERLELHREVGQSLQNAKMTLKHGEFNAWCEREFGRGREWRTTHLRLATNWQDFQEARAWALGKNLPSGKCYSIDAALRLLNQWRTATNQTSRKPCAKKPPAKETVAALKHDIAAIRHELQMSEERLMEARRFRSVLTSAEVEHIRDLMPSFNNGDPEAEHMLRSIAQQRLWIFQDLIEAEKSGGPDFSESPKADANEAGRSTRRDSINENICTRPIKAPFRRSVLVVQKRASYKRFGPIAQTSMTGLAFSSALALIQDCTKARLDILTDV